MYIQKQQQQHKHKDKVKYATRNPPKQPFLYKLQTENVQKLTITKMYLEDSAQIEVRRV